MFTLSIERDEDPQNPRTEFDNVGVLALFHKRYVLGDKDHGINSNDFNSWSEMEEYIIKQFRPAAILPVYMYDHSGITISHKPFNDRWDSGQIGFAFVPRDVALREFGGQKVAMNTRHKALQCLKAELKVYDQYLTGDIWGWVIKNEDGDVVDACWGYYGEEDCRQAGQEALAGMQKEAA